jgi:hypothetical protein
MPGSWRSGRTEPSYAPGTKTAAIAALIVLALSGAPAATSAGARNCSVAESRQLVVSFISAFNNGSSARLDRIFATAASFKWYSTDAPGRRLGPAAYARSTLAHYFASRHAQRERLLLQSWQGGGNANGYSHFQFRLSRQALDLQPTAYEGKGAIICSGSGDTIAVWSMGRRS